MIMSKLKQKKLSGGSLASDAVVAAVSKQAFTAMNANFTNLVPQSGGKPKRSTKPSTTKSSTTKSSTTKPSTTKPSTTKSSTTKPSTTKSSTTKSSTTKSSTTKHGIKSIVKPVVKPVAKVVAKVVDKLVAKPAAKIVTKLDKKPVKTVSKTLTKSSKTSKTSKTSHSRHHHKGGGSCSLCAKQGGGSDLIIKHSQFGGNTGDGLSLDYKVGNAFHQHNSPITQGALATLANSPSMTDALHKTTEFGAVSENNMPFSYM
jgi:hypothetical protein